MTHPGLRKPEDSILYWGDELAPSFGKFDLVETEAKPNFGKGKKAKNAHKIEQELPRFAEKAAEKYSEGKKPALILDFSKTAEDKFTCVNSGVFIVVQKVENSKKWSAQAYRPRWETPKFEADDPASALTKLVNYQRWFCHRKSMEWWSLGKLYRKVHFVLPFGKRKRMPAKGTFDREFSLCKHVDGHFAWTKPETRTVVVETPKKVYYPALPQQKTKSWPLMNDSKYIIVNGTLERRENWQENLAESSDDIGMI